MRPLATIIAAVAGLALSTTLLASDPHPRQRLHQIQPVAEAEANERAEIRVGREVAARILARHALHPDDELQRYVNRVGVALALHGTRPDLDFHFGVIESGQVNAYAAPGGYIFITSEALALMEDEAELAAVLAHEIAHVDRRHIVEALGIRAPESSPMAGLTRFFGGATEVAQVFFSQAVDQVLSVLFEEGLRHEDEFEADRDGVLLAARAGYDPGGLGRFLQRLSESADRRAVDEVADTHPATSERLKRLTALQDEENLSAIEGYRRQARFQRHVP
ncbi:M48 family metalloprotease [Natronospira bacteriovora]|uniref:M48 family metalloprotease n=1 Tax=Natronospira bacteriovora TaxID=3069753 RepID=A0ABU0W7P0_9GAMM|nr:M48 family metalloprotease [Natronospira sp. AB-CW4]MDQ2070053.1 M48 family metalloprotease [Natronospira sp. AB-CW4]